MFSSSLIKIIIITKYSPYIVMESSFFPSPRIVVVGYVCLFCLFWFVLFVCFVVFSGVFWGGGLCFVVDFFSFLDFFFFLLCVCVCVWVGSVF